MTLSPVKYLKIDDFSPGIFAPSVATLSGSGRRSPAPLGAALSHSTSGAAATFDCISLPGGGLGPLPKQIDEGSIGQSSIGVANPPANGKVQVVGMKVLGNVEISGTPKVNPNHRHELHLGFEWSDAGNTERFEWWRRNATSTVTWAWNQVVAKATAAIGSASPGTFSMTRTRMIQGGSQPTPVMVGSWAKTGLLTGFFWVFPQPLTAATLLEDTTHKGLVFAHQSRVLLFTPNGIAHGTGLTWDTDIINYTDPPLSVTMGTQSTVLLAEEPSGYGAIGSVSSGELFLVRQYGGALVMFDDIDYPRVVRLPGVMSTGSICQEGSFCSIGMLYCVLGDGVYAWNGDSSSQKVSSQLDPNFFLPTSTVPSGTARATSDNSSTYIHHCQWGPYVVFPNRYLFDARTGAWWTIGSLGAASDLNVLASLGESFYAIEQFATNTSRISRYDLTGPPVDSYAWLSQPIPLAADGHEVGIREIEIIWEPTTTGSQVLANVTSETGVTSGTLTFTTTTVGGAVKTVVALPTPLSAKTITFGMTVVGATNAGAPIIHSVALGYTDERSIVSYWL